MKRTTLKVMTYNIHACNPPSTESTFRDVAAIAQIIKNEEPDLVALSEVDNCTTRSGIDVNQAQELGKLTGMQWRFAKAIDRLGGEYGNAILSRLPISQSAVYALPSTGEKVEERSAGKVTVEKDGHTLHFVATHVEHRDKNARLLQVRKLLTDLDSLEGPVIIAGDWNSRPSSKTVALFSEKFTPTCEEGNYPLTFPATAPNRTIDYVMYRPASSFRALDVRTVNETYASDHLPVVAELELL